MGLSERTFSEFRTSSFSGGTGCVAVAVEVDPASFQKSSFSGSGGCVEAQPLTSGYVAVRDSKLGDDSPVICFASAAWHDRFIAAVLADAYSLTGEVVCIKLSVDNGHAVVEFCADASCRTRPCNDKPCTATDHELCYDRTEWQAFLDGSRDGQFTYTDARPVLVPAI